METCCRNFDDLISNVGKKGFSAIPLHSAGMLFFLLQSRSEGLDATEGITKIFEIGIKYCPFCGSELSNVINKNKDYFVRLAEKNKSLIYFGR